MSAFIVDKVHISAVLDGANISGRTYNSRFSWYYNGQRRELEPENLNEVGQMLLDENIKSVSYRYPDEKLTGLPGRADADFVLPYRHVSQPVFPIVQYIKLVDCLDYQSCEHPEYKASEAKCFLDSLKEQLIGLLPGYDEAKWELIES